MNTLLQLLQQRPVIFVHVLAALTAIVIGAVLLWGRKGTLNHRVLGWAWVVAMATTALTSLFIHGGDLPNIAGFSPIHGLALFVAWQLPRGVAFIRRGAVAGHRKTMQGLYIGACVVAGAFTLLPGRFLGQLVWGQWLGWV
jgi:uncharacterized membrane protein